MRGGCTRTHTQEYWPLKVYLRFILYEVKQWWNWLKHLSYEHACDEHVCHFTRQNHQHRELSWYREDSSSGEEHTHTHQRSHDLWRHHRSCDNLERKCSLSACVSVCLAAKASVASRLYYRKSLPCQQRHVSPETHTHIATEQTHAHTDNLLNLN